MAKTTITTGTTITTAETTTTITTTITITTEAPTPATETPAEAPTPATETPTPAEAPTPATGALPTPTEIATTTEVPAAETATAIATAIAPATALKEMQAAHEAAVNFCVELESDDFAELIRYAQHRNNKFPAYAVQLRDVINADDVYKDAICRICEPLGNEAVRKAIKLVDSKKILDLAEYLKYIKTIVEEWGDI